eukprot:6897842-Pyramimonas_sp.AAC.1
MLPRRGASLGVLLPRRAACLHCLLRNEFYMLGRRQRPPRAVRRMEGCSAGGAVLRRARRPLFGDPEVQRQ